MPKIPSNSDRPHGFTFVELVVALGIAAAVIVVAAMAYGTIAVNGISKRKASVNLSGSSLFPTEKKIAVNEGPSLSATAMANIMRMKFLDDLGLASAVVCLARNIPNTERPTNFIITTNIDARRLVTPEDFRTKLIDIGNNVYTNFSTNALGNGATLAPNLSIYILVPTTSATNVSVHAIYESDWFTTTNSPAGVYAVVRRFVGDTMTDYYHVFYPGSTHNPTNRPAAAFFTTAGTTNTNGNTNYNKAENRPFYFVWWPDPMNRTNGSQYPSETNSTNPRGDYMNQAGNTSYFLVFPAFPAL